ncbi:hypothetical protein VM1G_08927 [Cytospora mali]|uniref:Uncharacterized protein n=1 Tax=Cytospora mali TaxID=578113 RepID=A0A194W9Q8_CYTMA|nr:hypothetical protein VM1G_08927 [Valsa mali]
MRLSILAAALGTMIIAEASSANNLHHHYPYVADQVRGGLQPRQTGSGQNMQTFSGALGGIKADAITATGNADRPYDVSGDTFTDFASAAERSCDNQMNSCAEMANSGGANFSVGDCDDQASACREAIATESTTAATAATPATSSTVQTTSTATTPVSVSLVSQNAEFDFFCEE